MSAHTDFKNIELSNKWIAIKNIRKVITGAIEKKRAEKLIGSSLEAHINIYLTVKIKNEIKNINFAEVAITSSFEILNYEDGNSYFCIEDIADISIDVKKTKGEKCERCWKYKEDLTSDNICDRCEKVIK